MIIANFQKLAKNSLRRKALQIAEAGYEAIEIERIVRQRIKKRKTRGSEFLLIQYGEVRPPKVGDNNTGRSNLRELKLNLDNFKRVFIVGIGKGSALAAIALTKILGERLNGGIALDVQLPRRFTRIATRINADKKLIIFKGSHPLPSRRNVVATQKIIKLVKSLKKDDLLITFICGGGSALLCGSEKELESSRMIFKQLTSAGASIQEMNIVRKHLSGIKGGGLTKMAYPAKVISLIVSDVVGNELSLVASGPTVYDKTTKRDAEKVLNKYLRKSAYLSALIRVLTETPKDKRCFKNVKNILFVSNQGAVAAMVKKAKQLGFKPKIHSLKLQGEAKWALLPLIKSVKKGEAVLGGGETTVVMNNELGIKNYGKGGRNMEAVLGWLVSLPNSYFIIHNSLAISLASDGRDNTESAGAIGDILTLEKAQKLQLDAQKFLANHNSFHFFKKTGDLIFAKKTAFNVADLALVLSLPKE